MGVGTLFTGRPLKPLLLLLLLDGRQAPFEALVLVVVPLRGVPLRLGVTRGVLLRELDLELLRASALFVCGPRIEAALPDRGRGDCGRLRGGGVAGIL